MSTDPMTIRLAVEALTAANAHQCSLTVPLDDFPAWMDAIGAQEACAITWTAEDLDRCGRTEPIHMWCHGGDVAVQVSTFAAEVPFDTNPERAVRPTRDQLDYLTEDAE